MKWVQLKLALSESDPFYTREILFAVLFYIVISSYLSAQVYGGQSTLSVFLQNTTFSTFVVILLYGAMLSGILARGIETGSIGFIFTMPINRRMYILLIALIQSLIGAAIFIIPIAFVYWLTFYGINWIIIIIMYIAIASLLLMYISIGYLIAALTKSSIVTFILTFFIFSEIGSNSKDIFKNNLIAQFLLSGLSNIELHPLFTLTLKSYVIDSFMIALITCIFAVFGCYWLLMRGNLRSGR